MGELSGRPEPAKESEAALATTRRQLLKTGSTISACLKHQLGRCPTRGAAASLAEPLFLVDDEGNRLRLHFDCARCEMEIVLDSVRMGR